MRALLQNHKSESHSHPHMVNLWQTQLHRREKYWLARSLGYSSANAYRLRDFRLTKLESYLGLAKPTQILYPDGKLRPATTE